MGRIHWLIFLGRFDSLFDYFDTWSKYVLRALIMQVIKTPIPLDKPCQSGKLLQMGDWSNKHLPTSHNLTPMTIDLRQETTKIIDNENAEFHGDEWISQWKYQWWCRWRKQPKIWFGEPGFDWCPQMGDSLNVVEVGNCRKVEGGLSQKGNWGRERIPSNHRGFFFSMQHVCDNTFWNFIILNLRKSTWQWKESLEITLRKKRNRQSITSNLYGFTYWTDAVIWSGSSVTCKNLAATT